MKKKDDVTDKAVIVEHGATEDDMLVRVTRGAFNLQVVDPEKGPTQIVRYGDILRIKKETYDMNFYCNRIEPVELPTQFKVIRWFRTIKDNLYLDLINGDIIELDRDEAIPLMRKELIEPIKETKYETKSA